MLCYVMLCYVMLCYVMLCYVMLCYVLTRPSLGRLAVAEKKTQNPFEALVKCAARYNETGFKCN